MFTSGRWFGLSGSPADDSRGLQSPQLDPRQQPTPESHQPESQQHQSFDSSYRQPPTHPHPQSQSQSPSASPSASASPSTHSAAPPHGSFSHFFSNTNHGTHAHGHNDHAHLHMPSTSPIHDHLLSGHDDSTSGSLSESESQSDPHGSDSDDDEDDDQDTPDEEDLLWKDWFLTLPGNEFLVNVPDTFIEDEFNLTGLAAMVPFFHESLDLILDRDSEDNVDPDLVESSAQLLYTLIHARWIITKAGLQAMLEKIENRVFGVCPRVMCYGYPLLPVGLFDLPGMGAVKLYCHSCQDTYHPQSNRFARLDGASIGTTFPHLMFLSFPDLHDHILELTRDAASPDNNAVFYVPKMFGFRINEASVTPDAPRAYWLRALPGTDRRSGKVPDF